MAHIQIKSGKGTPGVAKIVVDGVDVSRQVLVEGFRVNMPESLEEQASVSMIVAADVLEVDLPDAVIKALRQDDESRFTSDDPFGTSGGGDND